MLILYAGNTDAQSCSVALKTMVNIGCFSSAGPLADQGSYTFQSAGYCQCQCVTLNKAVMATTKGSDCYCGDLLPPTDTVASNSSCNSPCNGYGAANCGGDGFWTVALTGLETSVDNAPAGSGSGSSSSTPPSGSQTPTITQTAAPSVITKAGQTIVVTASSSATNTSHSSGGGSKAGIAAGVVVGLVAIAAIVGGVYFFLRQRKRRAVEEEYRRNAAVNSFVAGKNKSEVSSTNDERLDPNITAFHRRQSIGSIADERDFSRRILQVSSFAPVPWGH